MIDIIQFWQYYTFLFPRQSLPYVLLIGLLLSIFLSPEAIDLLNLARQSKVVVFRNSFLLKIFTHYQKTFTYFWICFISALTASLVYVLFKLSTLVSIWLALLLQVLFAWQAFPIKRYSKPILKGRDEFYKEGTMLAFARLRSSLENPLKNLTLQETYKTTIEDLIKQINLYWFLPFLILILGFWPFTFFYLAFIIQYQNFQLENKIFIFLSKISHNVIIMLMRIFLIFIKASREDKEEFKDQFLDFKGFLFFNKNIKEKNLDNEKNKAANDREVKRELESEELNLKHLEFLEFLYLTSMTIIAGLALLIVYLRARI